jgi:hypothetical protein
VGASGGWASGGWTNANGVRFTPIRVSYSSGSLWFAGDWQGQMVIPLSFDRGACKNTQCKEHLDIMCLLLSGVACLRSHIEQHCH